MSAAPVRVGLVGAGAIGLTHAETLARSATATLVGVADPTPAAARLGDAHGVPGFPDLDALLAATAPDAVIIATPNELHVPLAHELVRRGIPMLVEKPLGATADEATLLADAAARAGVPVLVGHHRRHHPAVRAASAAIAEGALGRIVAASVTSFLRKPDDYFDVPWHRTAGTGGTFLINLIHDVDLLRHLCGEVVAVSAVASRAARGLDVEDTGALVLTFASGAVATIVVSDIAAAPWCWDLTAGDAPRFPVHAVDSHRIVGTDASVSLPDATVWSHAGDAVWTTPLRGIPLPLDAANAFDRQLDHFAAVARGEAEPVVGAADGARNVAIVEAVARAARTGRSVAV